MKLRFVFIQLILFIFPFLGNAAQFLSVTDIHFDPFDACSGNSVPCPIISKLMMSNPVQWPAIFERYEPKVLSKYGQDSNYFLLKSSLTEFKTLKSKTKLKFILLMGDYLAHNYHDKYVTYSGDESPLGYQSFVKKTMQFLTDEFKNTFPAIPIYAVIGNNDSYHGDYYSDPKGSFYRDTANQWSAFFKNPKNKANFLQMFPYAGYYEVTPPRSLNNKIIVLNSVLFSSKARGVGINVAAQQELNWLKRTLSNAAVNHQHVWLVFHIPAIIDAYDTLITKKVTPLWKVTYLQTFLSILSQYSKTIKGIFTSHLHMDAFAIYATNSGRVIFDSFTPAISPKFGNNPGFKIFKYNENNFDVNNFITYFLPINAGSKMVEQWKILYKFNNKYQPGCTHCLFVNGMNKLKTANALVPVFKKYYAVGNPTGQLIETHSSAWPYYWCAIHHFTVSGYDDCLAKVAISKVEEQQNH